MAKHKKQDGVQEERRARRAKRRRRFVFRAIIVLAALAIVVTLVNNWDKLSPDSLVTQIGNFFSGGSGDGFPVDVSGTPIYQMETADGCAVLLSDTYVTMINTSGKETMRRTHAYTDPLLRTAGKYVLIAETGGKRFQLETRSKTVLNQTVDYDIVTAAVHTNGNVAVVTHAEQGYNARLSVYSSRGELIYQRLCGSVIVDVAFSPNGKEIAIATIGADKGAMHSSIEVLSLQSSDSTALYTYTGNDSMLCRLAYLTDSVITAVADDSVWMYQPRANECKFYTFTDGELKAFAIGDKSVAVVTQSYGTSDGGTLAYIKTDATASVTASVQGTCRDVSASDDRYAVLTDQAVYLLNEKAVQEQQAVSADSKRVARIGDRVMVLGLQALTLLSN